MNKGFNLFPGFPNIRGRIDRCVRCGKMAMEFETPEAAMDFKRYGHCQKCQDKLEYLLEE